MSRPAPTLPRALRDAYTAAHYTLLPPHEGLVLRIGQPPPADVWRLAPRARSLAVVTAWNPFSEPLPPVENHRRQAALAAAIAQAGLRAWPAEGQDPTGRWTPEASLLVADATADSMDRWLRDWGQYALVQVRRGGVPQLRVHPSIRRREQARAAGECCPFCGARRRCAHLLLCVNVDEPSVLGGPLDDWARAVLDREGCNSRGLGEVIARVRKEADGASEQEFDNAPGQSGVVRSWYAVSSDGVKAAINLLTGTP